MDAKGKILAQMEAIQQAQDVVRAKNPEDIATYRALDDLNTALYAKLAALANTPVIPELSDQEVVQLTAAQQTLADATNASQVASQIIQSATTLARL